MVLVLGFLLGSLVGWWLVRRRPRRRFLIQVEYWVYLPGDAMPAQDEVMTWLVRPDEGAPKIGPAEALLFSDVRLHIALVLRAKNRHVFRPDLLEPHVDATPEELVTLDASRSLVKVRYVSEEPVPDRRYLTFLPQVVRALAELGGGNLVYDAVGERLLNAGGLRDGDPGPHIRWVAEASGGYVRTHGLKKLGLPEIRTAPIAADERWIVSEIIGQIAHAAWKTGDLPDVATAEAFDDRFRVSMDLGRDGLALARVHRLQAI